MNCEVDHAARWAISVHSSEDGGIQRALARGSEMRQALGTTVFSGMLGVTIFGLFLTPVFYVVLRRFSPDQPTERAAGEEEKTAAV